MIQKAFQTALIAGCLIVISCISGVKASSTDPDVSVIAEVQAAILDDDLDTAMTILEELANGPFKTVYSGVIKALEFAPEFYDPKGARASLSDFVGNDGCKNASFLADCIALQFVASNALTRHLVCGNELYPDDDDINIYPSTWLDHSIGRYYDLRYFLESPERQGNHSEWSAVSRHTPPELKQVSDNAIGPATLFLIQILEAQHLDPMMSPEIEARIKGTSSAGVFNCLKRVVSRRPEQFPYRLGKSSKLRNHTYKARYSTLYLRYADAFMGKELGSKYLALIHGGQAEKAEALMTSDIQKRTSVDHFMPDLLVNGHCSLAFTFTSVKRVTSSRIFKRCVDYFSSKKD